MEESLDMAPCLYFSFTDEGVLTSVNRTLCNKLGYTRSALIGASMDVLFSLSSRIFYQTHWFPLLKLKYSVDELFVSLVAKDKTILPVLVNSKRKETRGTVLNECVGMIITNRTRYEDELISARKAYEAALSTNAALASAKEALLRRTEELDNSFAYLSLQHKELKQINKIVTHDLQEPVRKLAFYTEQLKEQAGCLPTDALKNVERLQSVTKKLRDIISGLQQYIWLTELDTPFIPVDLNKIISTAITSLEVRFGKDRFTVQSDTLPSIQGNPEQLYAMFTHILDNAVRFAKPGQRQTVAIHSTIIEQNRFRHLESKYKYTDHVRITIVDNGTGIEEIFHDQVFELFYSLNNTTGAGLGLALSKKVVEHHHGTIELTSERGKGTTIILTLPFE